MSSSKNSELRKAFEVELKAYTSDYSIEFECRDRLLELLTYKNCFERSLLHGHFTASVWVINESKDKALFTHREIQLLVALVYADGNEDLRIVAMQECQEESGLSDFQFLSDRIFDIDIHTIPELKGVPEHDHYDVRFIFKAKESDLLTISEESHDVAWIPFSHIAKKTGSNDSILRMLNKTIKNRF